MKEIQVAIWGFGAMGSGIAKVLLGKKGVVITGVCDIHPDRVGKSIYELLGVERGDREDVKVIGQWRYNSDGIDLHNMQNAQIIHCFARTFDDCLVIKGVHKVGGMDTGHQSVRDILVENCVLWNDWGRALELGA